jgi:hypothetical protein
MKVISTSIKILFLISAILSINISNIFAGSFDHNHKDYDQLLQSNVKNGLLNYKAIKERPKGLHSYLDSLAKVEESTFNKWSEKERLTYLINLYNAATIKLIVDNYPIKSIRDINKEGQGPWKLEVVHLFRKKITLDHLEHEIIRKNYNEPRIHFALVCAAIGCPKLPSQSFMSSKLEEQLASRTRLYLLDKDINFIDENNKTIYLSSIFTWFAEDFNKTHGSILEFVKEYLPAEEANKVNSDYSLKFTEYDWTLNDGSS